MKSIGFIGAGNMASAIATGIVNSQKDSTTNRLGSIYVYDIAQEAMNLFKEKHGASPTSSIDELVEKSDVVVLSVKPNIFQTVLPELKGTLHGKLVVSIAAGKSIAFIENLLGSGVKIVRVMPNINARVLESMSAYCTNKNVDDVDIELVELLLNAIGKGMYLDEVHFPVFGVLAGSAPAYSYLFIDALATASVKYGLPKKVALQIASQTVFGSAKLVSESGQPPRELIDEVCSPGGTTIEGLHALQNNGFEAAINKAFDKAVEKDKKL